jgi:hypothetical protein
LEKRPAYADRAMEYAEKVVRTHTGHRGHALRSFLSSQFIQYVDESWKLYYMFSMPVVILVTMLSVTRRVCYVPVYLYLPNANGKHFPVARPRANLAKVGFQHWLG